MILASGSQIRRQLLENAGVNVTVIPARVDEEAIRQGLRAENTSPRDISDALADAKARKISGKHPEEFTLGCDQILDFKGKILTKSSSFEQAEQQLRMLRGQSHKLFSAAVIYRNGQPQWRHIGQVNLHMRDFSDAYLASYLQRNYDSARHAVGCYKLEEEGVRLFAATEGSYFDVLGLPLLEVLAFLTNAGELDV